MNFKEVYRFTCLQKETGMAENKLIMQVRKIKKLIEEKEGNHKGGGNQRTKNQKRN